MYVYQKYWKFTLLYLSSTISYVNHLLNKEIIFKLKLGEPLVTRVV